MALRRQESLNHITAALAWLAALCKLRGLIHLFDANVIAHEFFCKLLNEVFDLKLAVMDRVAANFPAIDLADETNRRSFQVTSDKSGDKVQKTLDTYAAHKLFEKYGRTSVLVIGEKQSSYNKLTLPTTFTFDPSIDILDLADLIKVIEALSTEKLERLAEIVLSEIKFGAREAALPIPHAQIRVMFFPADPTNGSQMALSVQLRGVKEKLRSPAIRQSVDLVSAWSDSYNGFLEWLGVYQPRILHLSGCGAKPSDFVLKAQNGNLLAVPSDVIRDLFGNLRGELRLVVLDGCLTGDQGKVIAEEINCVVRIDDAAPNDAIATFVTSFYQTIGQGGSIQKAFDDGRSALTLNGHTADFVKLFHREGVSPSAHVLVKPRPVESDSNDKIHFVQLEMATDQCLWEEMRHDRYLDVPIYNPMSGKPWFGQTYEIMPKASYPFGSHQLSNNHWTYEQKVAETRVADPVLEFTILNTTTEPVIVSRIGIRPENVWNVAKANPLAYKLESYDAYELTFDKFVIGEDITLRLPAPVCLEPKAPYRIRLRLRDYAKTVVKNETVIRLVVMADNETFVSDEIYLGIMWNDDSMLLGQPGDAPAP